MSFLKQYHYRMAIDTTAEKLSVLTGVRFSPQASQRQLPVGLPLSIHFITEQTNKLLASHCAQLEEDSSKIIQ
ncbi:unnamed protein product [Caenorhabditis nigoni]